MANMVNAYNNYIKSSTPPTEEIVHEISKDEYTSACDDKYFGFEIRPETYICLYKYPGFVDSSPNGVLDLKECMIIEFDSAKRITRRLVSISDVDGYVKCLCDRGYMDITDRVTPEIINPVT